VLSDGKRAYSFYFVHPDEDTDTVPGFLKGRAVLQGAELKFENGYLSCGYPDKWELS
jgi:hypothetical protein